MTSLLQALIRQCWSPHAMGAIQGERVGEQFGLRSNEAWVSEDRPSSQQHPSFPRLISQIGRVYNTTCSREQTQNVEGMGTSLLSPFFSVPLLMRGCLSNTVSISAVARRCTAYIWPSVKLGIIYEIYC